MTNILLVMGGGAIGSLARYLLGHLASIIAPTVAWPLGTFAANILGGFAMGLLAGWMAHFSSSTGEPWRLLIGVGLLGGFTTFSSFSLETLLMIERGQILTASAYALFSVTGAVAALALGLSIMRDVA